MTTSVPAELGNTQESEGGRQTWWKDFAESLQGSSCATPDFLIREAEQVGREEALGGFGFEEQSIDEASDGTCSADPRQHSKLGTETAWWAPLAREAVSLAEDVSQSGWLPGGYSKLALSRGIWKKFRRYRHILMFVAAVTTVNGLFTLLLVECLVGNSQLCVFGGCHSPNFSKQPSVAYDRSTMNVTLAAAAPPTQLESREFRDEDDEAFLNELASDWRVLPHPSVPRAYSLTKIAQRQGQGELRAFLVQDVCYLHLPTEVPDRRSRSSGIWFDGDSLEAVANADFRSLLDARELQKLGPLELLTTDDVSLKNGASGSSSDLGKLQKQMNRSVGAFVGPTGISDYLAGSSPSAMRDLMEAGSPKFWFLGIVLGAESNAASFSSHFVLLTSLASSSSSRYWESGHVVFPGDRGIASSWTSGAIAAVLGPQALAVSGQGQGRPLCFRNALFSLATNGTASWAPADVDVTRAKAWSLADTALTHFRAMAQSPPSSQWQRKASNEALLTQARSALASAPAGIGLQLGLSKDVMRSALHMCQLAAAPSAFQVTVLVDSLAADGKGHSSKIANLDAVLKLIQKLFPKLAIELVILPDVSFLEQVAVFKRTALLLTPHSIATGMASFLPPGASMVEIFPYMFRSDAGLSMASMAKLSYFRWENEQLSNSKYDNDCLVRGNYLSMSAAECRRHRPCLFCVRDHVSTIVDKRQFHAVLLQTQRAVRSFLEEHAPQARKSS